MTKSEIFSGGLPGYREFLLRKDGAADPVRFRLAERFEAFAGAAYAAAAL